MENVQMDIAATRMKGKQKLPSDSKMEKAVERAKTADGDTKGTVKSAKIAQGDEGPIADGK